MRLIDADAFIETNKDIIDCSIDHSKYEDTLRELIDNAPTVDTTCPNCDSSYAQGYSDGYLKGKEDRPQGEWIPVSERLPEQANQSYLVTVDFGGGQLLSCAMYFYGGDIGWNYEGITAWMPLPEPYKEETDNEHL